MPKWGLTVEMREANAWELPPELLNPGKIITDPVHGDVYVLRLEQRVLDSPPFQRLRRVRQLGTTHLVYPGASHSRFSHALGALRTAQDLLAVVVDQQSSLDPLPDLFDQWTSDQSPYMRRVAEATVLARIGALMHDFCHVPYGHTIEDELSILRPHDANVERFELLWGALAPDLKEIFANARSLDGRSLEADLRPLILSKEEGASDTGAPGVPEDGSYPFVADIIGNTISADLVDYLQRDHLFTGLPSALGHRLFEGFYVTRDDDPRAPRRMAVRIRRRDGSERRDTITELFKYLRFRYELSERALVHHAKLAADAMIGKALEMWHDALFVEIALDNEPSLRRSDLSDIEAFKSRYRNRTSQQALDDAEDEGRRRMETALLAYGDDGLLERLADYESDTGRDGRRRAIGVLARSLLDRQLFKPLAHAHVQSEAGRIYADWGSPAQRRRLEQKVAAFADIEPAWHVVLWIPPPEMRLKAALVLVDDGDAIRPLVEREQRGQDRGNDIYDAHRDLWAVSVFTHRSVTVQQREAVLARLAELLDIRWDDEGHPHSVRDLAIRVVGDERGLSRRQEDELAEQLGQFYRGASGDDAGFEDILQDVRSEAAALEVADSAEQPPPDEAGDDLLSGTDGELADSPAQTTENDPQQRKLLDED